MSVARSDIKDFNNLEFSCQIIVRLPMQIKSRPAVARAADESGADIFSV